MRKFITGVLIILAFLLELITLAGYANYHQNDIRLKRVYLIQDEQMVIPTDTVSISYGKHIFQFHGCEACHGEHLEGKVYLDDPALGQVDATNLTAGLGGVGKQYNEPDWVRAIRHGVHPDGTPLLFMPSTEFYFLSDEDLFAVIGYIKCVPPINNEISRSKLSPTGWMAMTFIKDITFLSAELIPHDAARPLSPRPGLHPSTVNI